MALDKDILFNFEQYNWQGEEKAFLELLRAMNKMLENSKGLAEEDEHEGPELADGDVVMPAGITKILKKTRDMDIMGITSSYGGEVPIMTSVIWYDMLAAVHPCAQLTQMLTDDAIEVLDLIAPEDIKQKYLPKMMKEDWYGAMVMTEPRAGSDLGGIAATAAEITEGDYEGMYNINGEKIFITTPNAEVLIVLGRDADTEAETAGTTKGLSMYLVPKFLDDDSRNSYAITNLEKKLGIKASPTGGLFFDNAKAHLIGEKGKGMKQFFRLMNFARVAIACQSLGISQAAFDYALEFAVDTREQFGKKISEFPAVQRILVDMKVNVEATRSLIYAAGQAMDSKKMLEQALADDPENSDLQDESKAQASKTYTLVCLAKYLAPKLGERVTSDAIQILGGTGYMEEYPVARHFRDMKITDIYEGTGQMQAVKVATDVIKGRFDDELESISEYLDGRDDTASTLLRDELSDFRAAVKDLAASERDYKGLHQETLTAELSKIYSCYLLIQQSESSPRKAIVADIYASSMFESGSKRMSGGNQSIIEHFDEIVHYKEIDD